MQPALCKINLMPCDVQSERNALGSVSGIAAGEGLRPSGLSPTTACTPGPQSSLKGGRRSRSKRPCCSSSSAAPSGNLSFGQLIARRVFIQPRLEARQTGSGSPLRRPPPGQRAPGAPCPAAARLLKAKRNRILRGSNMLRVCPAASPQALGRSWAPRFFPGHGAQGPS